MDMIATTFDIATLLLRVETAFGRLRKRTTRIDMAADAAGPIAIAIARRAASREVRTLARRSHDRLVPPAASGRHVLKCHEKPNGLIQISGDPISGDESERFILDSASGTPA
jgi:redox-regulated HSP33 family molecular chaperone